ncbi:uncharacterized protein LOC144209837 [Stigmatopora nigra]
MPHHTACSPYPSLSFFLSTRLPSAPSLAPPARRFVKKKKKNKKLSFLQRTDRTEEREEEAEEDRFCLPSRLGSISTSRSRAASSVSYWDQPPPSFQGALPTTGRGREITTSQFTTDPQEKRQAERAQEGEGILEARQERQHPGLQKKPKKKRSQFSL